jgi:signal transduction histidine kinase
MTFGLVAKNGPNREPRPVVDTERQLSRTTVGAIWAGVVGVCLATTLAFHDLPITAFRGQMTLALGLLYIAFGSFCSRCAIDREPIWGATLKFLVLGALLVGILCASHFAGDLWIASLPLATLAAIYFPRPVATAIQFGLYLLVMLTLGYFTDPRFAWHQAPGLFCAFVFVAIFSTITLRAIEHRRRAEQLSGELNGANQRLVAQSAQIADLATVVERNRVARDIHDGLGHYLTTIAVQLEAAEAVQASDPARMRDALAKARRLAQEALVEVRNSVGALKETPRTGDLLSSLRDLAATADQAGFGALNVHLDIQGTPCALGAERESALIRVVQEALTNVRKHASAKNVLIGIDYSQPSRTRLVVLDDGRGCGPTAGGYGLAGLKDRLIAQGGRFESGNVPEGGFQVSAEFDHP